MILLSAEILIFLMIVLLIFEGIFLKTSNLLSLSNQIIISFFAIFLMLFAYKLNLQASIVLLSALSLVISNNWFETKKFKRFEFPIILAATTLTLLILSRSDNVAILFFAFILFTISSSILIIYKRKGSRSTNAGIKYVITMSLSILIFLTGILILIYNNQDFILSKITTKNIYVEIALSMVLMALFMPALIIPFSIQNADTYEGALTPASCFILSTAKIPFFMIIVKIIPLLKESIFFDYIKVFAICTILLPAISSLNQQSMKRLLTKLCMVSSGFLLLFITYDSTQNISFYLLAESFAILSIFSFILSLNLNGTFLENLQEIKGIGKRYPITSILFSIAVLSLCGFPVLSGFVIRHDLITVMILNNNYLSLIFIGTSLAFTLCSGLRVVRSLYLDYESPKLEPLRYSILFTLFLSISFVLSSSLLKVFS